MIELLTISEVRRRTQNGFVTARVHAQVESASAKATREGKPYCEISLADACDRMMLRVWDNHPDYTSCSALQNGDFIEIDGEFAQTNNSDSKRKPGNLEDLPRMRLQIFWPGRPSCEPSNRAIPLSSCKR